MSRRQQWVYHIEPEEFPPDFPQRLDAFRRAAGFSWRGLARRLKVNARTVFRWKAGAAIGSGHLVSLFTLAAAMGLLHLLLPEAGEPGEGANQRTNSISLRNREGALLHPKTSPE